MPGGELRVLAFRGVALACALAAVAACSDHLPRTPLFQGVETLDLNRGAQVIRSRVDRAFPVGHGEAGFEAYLRGQGMRTRRITEAAEAGLPIYGEASARGAGAPCPRVAMVIWRADRAGVIRSLKVLYEQATCV